MIFDLAATVMMSIGLLYVAASVYQMLRGAEILFSAIFAVAFLKRRLTKFHYGGIACCLVGIGMVGASSLLSPGGSAQSADAGKVLLGMILIVVAQVTSMLFLVCLHALSSEHPCRFTTAASLSGQLLRV